MTGCLAHPRRPLLQIWLLPDTKGVTPKYAERSYAQAEPGRLHLVASTGGRDGSIPIYQDADVYIAKLGRGNRIDHPVRPGRHAWAQIADGEVVLNGPTLGAGDGAAISDESSLEILAPALARLVLFDLR